MTGDSTNYYYDFNINSKLIYYHIICFYMFTIIMLRYMWLSPNSYENWEIYGICTILFIFDEPITLGCIKFWNYSKNPSRGAKDIKVSFFHLFLYLYFFLLLFFSLFYFILFYNI